MIWHRAVVLNLFPQGVRWAVPGRSASGFIPILFLGQVQWAPSSCAEEGGGPPGPLGEAGLTQLHRRRKGVWPSPMGWEEGGMAWPQSRAMGERGVSWPCRGKGPNTT